MAFSIEFTGDPILYPYEDESIPAAKGRLLLGGDVEGFIANLGEWSQAMYRSQWRQSLDSLLNGESKAVLITTYSDPSIASHLEWWALYVVGDKVYLQNQLLFYDDLRKPFSIEKAADCLVDRKLSGGDGEVSEWAITLEDVRKFIDDEARSASS